jgi:hypothetical protein
MISLRGVACIVQGNWIRRSAQAPAAAASQITVLGDEAPESSAGEAPPFVLPQGADAAPLPLDTPVPDHSVPISDFHRSIQTPSTQPGATPEAPPEPTPEPTPEDPMVKLWSLHKPVAIDDVRAGVERPLGNRLRVRPLYTANGITPNPPNLYYLTQFTPPTDANKRTEEARIESALIAATRTVGPAIEQRVQNATRRARGRHDVERIIAAAGGGIGRALLSGDPLFDVDHSTFGADARDIVDAVTGRVGGDALLDENMLVMYIGRAKKTVIAGFHGSCSAVFEIAVAGKVGDAPASGGRNYDKEAERAEIAALAQRLDASPRAVMEMLDDGRSRDIADNGIYLVVRNDRIILVDTADALSVAFPSTGAPKLRGPTVVADKESRERLLSRLCLHEKRLRRELDDASITVLKNFLGRRDHDETRLASYEKYLERLAKLGRERGGSSSGSAQAAGLGGGGAGGGDYNNPVKWMEHIFERLGVDLTQNANPWANELLRHLAAAVASEAAKAAKAARTSTTTSSPSASSHLLPGAVNSLMTAAGRSSCRHKLVPSHPSYVAKKAQLDYLESIIAREAESAPPNLLGTHSALEFDRVAGNAPGPRRGDLYVEVGCTDQLPKVFWRFTDAATESDRWAPTPPARSRTDNGPKTDLFQTTLAAESGTMDGARVIRVVVGTGGVEDFREVLLEYKDTVTVRDRLVVFGVNQGGSLERRFKLLERAGLLSGSLLILTSRHTDAPFSVALPMDHARDALAGRLPDSDVPFWADPQGGGFACLAFPATREKLVLDAQKDPFYARCVVAFPKSSHPSDILVARVSGTYRCMELLGIREMMDDAPPSATPYSPESSPLSPRLAPSGTAAAAQTFFERETEAQELTLAFGLAGERAAARAFGAMGEAAAAAAATGGAAAGGAAAGGGAATTEGHGLDPSLFAAVQGLAVLSKSPTPLSSGRHVRELEAADLIVGRPGALGFEQRLTALASEGFGALNLLWRVPDVVATLKRLIAHGVAAQSAGDESVPVNHASVKPMLGDVGALAAVLTTRADAHPDRAAVISGRKQARDALMATAGGFAAALVQQGQQATGQGTGTGAGTSAAPAALADRSAAQWHADLLAYALELVYDAFGEAADAFEQGVGRDPWIGGLFPDKTIVAVFKKVKTVGGEETAASGAAAAAAAGGVVVAAAKRVLRCLVQEIVPHSSLGYDFWQVRFARSATLYADEGRRSGGRAGDEEEEEESGQVLLPSSTRDPGAYLWLRPSSGKYVGLGGVVVGGSRDVGGFLEGAIGVRPDGALCGYSPTGESDTEFVRRVFGGAALSMGFLPARVLGRHLVVATPALLDALAPSVYVYDGHDALGAWLPMSSTSPNPRSTGARTLIVRSDVVVHGTQTALGRLQLLAPVVAAPSCPLVVQDAEVAWAECVKAVAVAYDERTNPRPFDVGDFARRQEVGLEVQEAMAEWAQVVHGASQAVVKNLARKAHGLQGTHYGIPALVAGVRNLGVVEGLALRAGLPVHGPGGGGGGSGGGGAQTGAGAVAGGGQSTEEEGGDDE